MKPDEKYTIALTGATGFLGSHLMADLLKAGHNLLITGRRSNDSSLEERIVRLLEWFGIENNASSITFYETDFSKEKLGLKDQLYSDLCSRTDILIHCASDTSFTESKRDRVFETNVANLESILEFASSAKVRMFHYISTAYAAGIKEGLCPEEPVTSEKFTNPYEESKAKAESIVTEYCNSKQIPYTIIRPSIVYGDSVTGRSLSFNALYYPVKSLMYIRDIYINDIRNSGGKKSGKYGIHFDNNGTLHIPININIPQTGYINLIPVDYFISTAMNIIAQGSSGTIYHIASSMPSTLEILTDYTCRFLNISGIHIVYGENNGKFQNPAEELFDHYMRPYRPYLSDLREFEIKNSAEINDQIRDPELTYEIFSRCMNYAVSVDWGKKL